MGMTIVTILTVFRASFLASVQSGYSKDSEVVHDEGVAGI
jgi:hypothetical protein